MTYEIQPPSYTSLKLLTGPPRGGGGDTLWASQYAVYDLLSPGMQKYLEGLEALHSSQIQADGSIALGRTVRREPVITKHPLIRTHPVTGWKSVFFNPGMCVLRNFLFQTLYSWFWDILWQRRIPNNLYHCPLPLFSCSILCIELRMLTRKSHRVCHGYSWHS